MDGGFGPVNAHCTERPWRAKAIVRGVTSSRKPSLDESIACCTPVRARRLVARLDAVRGLPGRDPDAEHVLVERGEGARRPARARAAVSSRDVSVAHRRDRTLIRPVRDVQREGAARARVPGLPEAAYGGLDGAHARGAHRRAARRAPRGAWNRPRDRGLHRALRRGPALFVVDAYTRRVFGAAGFLRGGESYDEVQRFFTSGCPRTRRCSTSSTRRSCGWRRRCAGHGRCVGRCPLEAVCARARLPQT